MRKGEEYQNFPSKIFCLTEPKISVGESFIVALISGTGKFWIGGGRSIKIFRRNILSHSAENFHKGILNCCSNFS